MRRVLNESLHTEWGNPTSPGSHSAVLSSPTPGPYDVLVWRNWQPGSCLSPVLPSTLDSWTKLVGYSVAEGGSNRPTREEVVRVFCPKRTSKCLKSSAFV